MINTEICNFGIQGPHKCPRCGESKKYCRATENVYCCGSIYVKPSDADRKPGEMTYKCSKEGEE